MWLSFVTHLLTSVCIGFTCGTLISRLGIVEKVKSIASDVSTKLSNIFVKKTKKDFFSNGGGGHIIRTNEERLFIASEIHTILLDVFKTTKKYNNIPENIENVVLNSFRPTRNDCIYVVAGPKSVEDQSPFVSVVKVFGEFVLPNPENEVGYVIANRKNLLDISFMNVKVASEESNLCCPINKDGKGGRYAPLNYFVDTRLHHQIIQFHIHLRDMRDVIKSNIIVFEESSLPGPLSHHLQDLDNCHHTNKCTCVQEHKPHQNPAARFTSLRTFKGPETFKWISEFERYIRY